MTSSPAAHAMPGPGGDQFVEIVVDHGYRPQSIVARAGAPLRLVFRRRDDDECMDRIVFSSPHVDRRLPRGCTTTIVLPAQPPGEVRFTCGMGRYHGAIELRSQAAPTHAAVRAALTAGLSRAWLFIRGPKHLTGEQEASAIARARFARGEINEEEFKRARALALLEEGELSR